MIYKNLDEDQVALEMIALAEDDLNRELTQFEKIAFMGAARKLVQPALGGLTKLLKGTKTWGKSVAGNYEKTRQLGVKPLGSAVTAFKVSASTNPYHTAAALSGGGAVVGATANSILGKDKQDTYDSIRAKYASFDRFLDEVLEKQAEGENKWLMPAIGLGAATGAGLLLRRQVLNNKMVANRYLADNANTLSAFNNIAGTSKGLNEEASAIFNNLFKNDKASKFLKEDVSSIVKHIDRSSRDLNTLKLGMNAGDINQMVTNVRTELLNTIEAPGVELSQEIKTYLKDYITARIR